MRNGDSDVPVPGRPLRGAILAAAALMTISACSAVSGDDHPHPDVTATQPLPAPDAPGGSGDDGAQDEEGEQGDTEQGRAGDGPLAGTTVVVDPGHNGGNADASDEINALVPAGPEDKACDTVGAETDDGYTEHEFNWDFSQRLRDHLEADGATVLLTREDDDGVGPCIDERAAIGNEAQADAAVSIHADGGPADGRGFHVIAPGRVEGYTDDIVEPSRDLAEDLRAEFEAGAGQPPADYLADEGLDERTDLGGLNMSRVPKVFLEAGNMRNAEDAENLTDPEWRETASAAVAAGIARYLSR
ncbi:N-acetylmuramoyl-L-alanine amidase [Nocardiopsis sediminis]|uniref:N-acetylmuramoyl-L-alanine amidase n=1 Tax=Nocardiopsis sediminis TaxID=1778267 RepID=A0ABV8FSX6_9ACTN